MSNLLTGLAMALGGGLQGYARGKQLQWQQRMEEEEQAERRRRMEAEQVYRAARDARSDSIQDASLAVQGIRRRGTGPTESILRPEGTATRDLVAQGLGVNPTELDANPDMSPVDLDTMRSSKWTPLTADFEQDITSTDAYKQDQQKQEERSKRTRIMGFIELSMSPDPKVRRQATAALAAEGISVPKSPTIFKTDEDTGFEYRFDEDTGRMIPVLDSEGRPFGGLSPRRTGSDGASVGPWMQLLTDARTTARGSEDAFGALMRNRPTKKDFADNLTFQTDTTGLRQAMDAWRADSTRLATRRESDAAEYRGLQGQARRIVTGKSSPAAASTPAPESPAANDRASVEAAVANDASQVIAEIMASPQLSEAEKHRRVLQVNARLEEVIRQLRAGTP